MESIKQVIALREGGEVKRAHTKRYNGEYTVATHSYNAVNMLLVLHPNPSVNLIKALMWHDIPERWTGDIPSPAKWVAPELKHTLDKLEERVLARLGLAKPFLELTKEDKDWISAIDFIELFLWTSEQVNAGNDFLAPMQSRVAKIIAQRMPKYPKQVKKYLEDSIAYEKKNGMIQTPEIDELLA